MSQNHRIRKGILFTAIFGGVVAVVSELVQPDPFNGITVTVVRAAVVLGSAAFGLVYAEREWIEMWAQDLVKAARVLRWQKQFPRRYVTTSVHTVSLFPGNSRADHDIDRVDYIEITFDWDNDLVHGVIVSDIRGTVQIDGIDPPAVLPPNVKDEELGAIDTSRTRTPVKIGLSGQALEKVRAFRRQKWGDRGGLVCLNSAARFDKWNRAAVR